MCKGVWGTVEWVYVRVLKCSGLSSNAYKFKSIGLGLVKFRVSSESVGVCM